MKKYSLLIVLLIIAVTANNCRTAKKRVALTSHDVNRVIAQMSDAMIHDVTNPPLAARFFAYTCLAGYEVMSENDTTIKSMHGSLNNYPEIKKPAQLKEEDYQLSALLAMLETAGKLQPSGSLLIKYEERLLDSCRKLGMSQESIDSSRSYARFVSKKILAYAKADKYNRISNYSRYKESSGAGDWHPTPPSYMVPVEPYFNTIRPLTLDSASQFVPDPPTPFSTDKNSAFYKSMVMNYKASGKALTTEQRTIAGFWDCNPFAVENDGHMLIGLKKISPGAHWMGIVGIACDQAKMTLNKTIVINTAVAIGLLDSFICCWDDKYRTNRIRPETAIRRYIDPNWKPLLQTPPFPEYISGHSVVSATSALILTHYFGDRFHYTDNVEENFGLVPRKFDSFDQAASEAAISRFYGGIHFKDAIDKGVVQGKQVGEWVIKKIKAG
jgi:hypothetical protein